MSKEISWVVSARGGSQDRGGGGAQGAVLNRLRPEKLVLSGTSIFMKTLQWKVCE